MTREIPLSRGLVAIVDDADFERVNQFKWHAAPNKRSWCAMRSVVERRNRKNIRLHAFLMNPPLGMQVDHINGDRLDNRRENLRIVTNWQNQMNRGMTINNSSGYKGVRLRRSGKWEAQIRVNKKAIFLGRFYDKLDAAHAYDDAAKKYFGEFARLNFPESSQHKGAA